MPQNLEAKSLTDIASYTEKGAKTEGITSGYIAEKDDSTYMIKDSNSSLNTPLTNKQSSEKNDFLSEFVVAPLYKRILFDRAPEIGIAKSQDSKNLFLRSKFIENFSELGDHVNNTKENNLGFKKIDGFEKAIAASIFLADPDYHSQNLGITSQNSNEHLVVKIDHGRSLNENYNSSDDLMKKFIDRKSTYHYNNIEFDIYKFNQAINSITQISDAEIEDSLKSQTYKLQKYGFTPEAMYYEKPIHTPIIYGENPNNNEISFRTISASKISIKLKDQPESFIGIVGKQVMLIKEGENDQPVPDISPQDLRLLSVSIKRGDQNNDVNMITQERKLLKSLGDLGVINEKKHRFEALNEHIVDKVKTHKEFFQELEEKTAIIEKIDADPQFKKGGWVNEIFSDNPSKNPVFYALEKGLTIEGKKPVEWVIQNDKTTEKKLTIDFLTVAIKANNIEALTEYATHTKSITKDLSLLNLAELHGSKELNDELKKTQNEQKTITKQNKENFHPNLESVSSINKEIKKLRAVFQENNLTKNPSSSQQHKRGGKVR